MGFVSLILVLPRVLVLTRVAAGLRLGFLDRPVLFPRRHRNGIFAASGECREVTAWGWQSKLLLVRSNLFSAGI